MQNEVVARDVNLADIADNLSKLNSTAETLLGLASEITDHLDGPAPSNGSNDKAPHPSAMIPSLQYKTDELATKLARIQALMGRTAQRLGCPLPPPASTGVTSIRAARG